MVGSANSQLPQSSDSPQTARFAHEDWITGILGFLLVLCLLAVGVWDLRPGQAPAQQPSDAAAEAAAAKGSAEWRHPWAKLVGSVGKWDRDPREAFVKGADSLLPGVGGAAIFLAVLTALGRAWQGESVPRYLCGFAAMFLLATAANVLAGQKVVHHFNLEYALWAIMLGLLISNTIGTPAWLRPAVKGEYFIKLGLVLLGAEVLFSKLLKLGLPGVCVAWIVTPIVLVGTYQFGQRVLKLPSRSLNLVISADMSVCGVSAAIATAAACRAKKEELSLAIGMSLLFTVLMMVVMPPVIAALDLPPRVGGAWIGGTIDSTGAVAAAGSALGEEAEQIAVTVKMIQNILIGIVAVAVAAYWTRYVESSADPSTRANWGEVWRRFPKFILGFLASSLLISLLYSYWGPGKTLVDGTVGTVGKTLRGWLFSLAFVSIGLDTNFRELTPYLRSGKPLVLYVCGQCFNLALTLAMAYLMFGKLFAGGAN